MKKVFPFLLLSMAILLSQNACSRKEHIRYSTPAPTASADQAPVTTSGQGQVSAPPASVDTPPERTSVAPDTSAAHQTKADSLPQDNRKPIAASASATITIPDPKRVVTRAFRVNYYPNAPEMTFSCRGRLSITGTEIDFRESCGQMSGNLSAMTENDFGLSAVITAQKKSTVFIKLQGRFYYFLPVSEDGWPESPDDLLNTLRQVIKK